MTLFFSDLIISRTLSEKFSKIAAQNINVNARQTRKIVVVRGQANRRAAQANAKRGISTVNRQDSRRTGAQKRPPMKNQSRPAVRGKGRGGKGCIYFVDNNEWSGNSGRRNKDNNKASPKSQSELDLELDTCKFGRPYACYVFICNRLVCSW